ncbi:hypothetical protein G7046_g9732 [Stylonectria norvegica]|nr:hypothetical protein G7046_g9732 [Stylonectria norvegica]
MLEEALHDGTYAVYSAEPDDTTVNKVRKHVAEKLGLDESFFSSGTWKYRSKTIIKQRVDKLLDGWVPESKQKITITSGVKRSSSEVDSPEPKRQKRGPKPKKPVKKKEESDASDFGEDEKPKSKRKEDSDVSEDEKPRTKKKVNRATAKRKAKLLDSDDEDTAMKSDTLFPDRKRKLPIKDDDEDEEVKDANAKEKPAKVESVEVDKVESEDEVDKVESQDEVEKVESDDEVQKLESDEEQNTVKKQDASDEDKPSALALRRSLKPEVGGEGNDSAKDEIVASVKDEAKDLVEDEKHKPIVDEEDDYSDVIDEPAKPKRRKGAKREKSVKKEKKEAKPPKASKAAAKKVSTPDDPDEAEIKKLQSQLNKCGIRKLWHMELKKHGSDTRAKIRHLKKMLADVGIDGRFSEAKAREIKEMRELQAEAEAAQEMDALWGNNDGRRASRSKTKVSKVEESDDSAGDDKTGIKDGDDDEDEDKTFAARRKRVHAELAFLGDDSDSD